MKNIGRQTATRIQR